MRTRTASSSSATTTAAIEHHPQEATKLPGGGRLPPAAPGLRAGRGRREHEVVAELGEPVQQDRQRLQRLPPVAAAVVQEDDSAGPYLLQHRVDDGVDPRPGPVA